jgi:hypothetical protein
MQKWAKPGFCDGRKALPVSEARFVWPSDIDTHLNSGDAAQSALLLKNLP